MTKKNKYILLLISIFLIPFLFGLFMAKSNDVRTKMKAEALNEKLNGTWLSKPRNLAAFSLEGMDGQPFNNAHLQGHWTMIFFGFTSCRTICPTTMAELAKMYALLQEKNVKELPEVVMISIDPDRDNLIKLRDYVSAFNPQFYAARGNEEEIKRMTQELGIAFAKIAIQDPKEAESYDIQHSGTVMLFNPKGQLNGFFTIPHPPEQMAQDYRRIVSAS